MAAEQGPGQPTESDRQKLMTILVPAAIYLAMALTMAYPQTERVTSNVSTGAMWQEAARPLFLLLYIALIVFFALRMALSISGKKRSPFFRMSMRFDSDIGAPVSAYIVCRNATSRTAN